ncbi:hypothetical protein LTR08_000049 [Meristemomyces frigidus]|nr:hypothetical protein LTR08_000049 [Meristemomyces frigidus]
MNPTNPTYSIEDNTDSVSMDLSMDDTPPRARGATPIEINSSPVQGTPAVEVASQSTPAIEGTSQGTYASKVTYFGTAAIEVTSGGTPAMEVTSPPIAAAKPQGRKKSVAPSPAAVKTPAKKRGKSTADGQEEETPKKKAKGTPKERQRKAPAKTPAGSRPIPRNYDEAEECDKMLVKKRDANVTWTEIRAEWEKLTGETIGTSTLPNRYKRLTINFAVVKEEDHPKLLSAKRTVEEAFEKGRWAMIAATMETLGGDVYKPEILQRQYMKMMKAADTVPPAGVVDRNFDSKLEDDNE